jgi:hypothetical protein
VSTTAAPRTGFGQLLRRWRTARGLESGQRVVLPLEYRSDQGVLRFLNTTTSFATPLDAALSEIFIEAFYPADEATRRVLAARPLPSW